MTESRNERVVEPMAEAEAEDCAGLGIVPGPLVASGRMGPGLCRALDGAAASTAGISTQAITHT